VIIPFNGRRLEDLTMEEKKVFDNSAIPVVERIVREKVEEIKAASTS